MKHIIKKVIILAVVFLFVLAGMPFVLATNDNCTDKVYMTPEYQAEVAELKEKVENYLENKVTPYSGSYVVRNVPCYMQEKTYTCSTACIQMIDKYKNGTKTSQTVIEEYQRSLNDDHWNYVYIVTQALNHYVGGYEYVNTDDLAFASGLIYSIDNNMPLICHIKTVDLPNYDAGQVFGHYVVATGYYAGFSGNSSVARVYYNDPHYNSDHFGSFYCDISQMRTCINANQGYYIMSS